MPLGVVYLAEAGMVTVQVCGQAGCWEHRGARISVCTTTVSPHSEQGLAHSRYSCLLHEGMSAGTKLERWVGAG